MKCSNQVKVADFNYIQLLSSKKVQTAVGLIIKILKKDMLLLTHCKPTVLNE